MLQNCPFVNNRVRTESPRPSHTTGHAGPHPAVRQVVGLKRCLVAVMVFRPKCLPVGVGQGRAKDLGPAIRQYPLLPPTHFRMLLSDTAGARTPGLVRQRANLPDARDTTGAQSGL